MHRKHLIIKGWVSWEANQDHIGHSQLFDKSVAKSIGITLSKCILYKWGIGRTYSVSKIFKWWRDYAILGK